MQLQRNLMQRIIQFLSSVFLFQVYPQVSALPCRNENPLSHLSKVPSASNKESHFNLVIEHIFSTDERYFKNHQCHSDPSLPLFIGLSDRGVTNALSILFPDQKMFPNQIFVDTLFNSQQVGKFECCLLVFHN